MNENKKYRNADSLWIILSRAYKSIEKKDTASIRSIGFNCASDFAVLEILLHKGPLPVNTIGEKILLTSGSITTAVSRLEKTGLVYRKTDEEDARKTIVLLTESGEAKIRQAYHEHALNLEKAMNTLNGEEREQLAHLLKKLSKK
jgi:MarR family 2-MHQ and catechol resistance regulon transcriptional repressor